MGCAKGARLARAAATLVLGLALVGVADRSEAEDCTAACSLVCRDCIRGELGELRACLRPCRGIGRTASGCRRVCHDAYGSAKDLCRGDRRLCKLDCRGLSDSCRQECGAVAEQCFATARTAGRTCHTDCKRNAIETRARCRRDFVLDLGPCLEAAGDEQSRCLEACGATRFTTLDACAAEFESCREDCVGSEPPSGEPGTCNVLDGRVEAVRSLKEKGATRLEWNSSFVHLGYLCPDAVHLTSGDLEIAVLAGAAQFVEFVDNKRQPFTPVGEDPAAGVIDPGPGDVTVTFTGLHYDETCDVFIGNGHLKARVRIDKDGDGTLESLADLGVNLHVEAEVDCP